MEDTTYFPLCLEIISYTSFPMINCYFFYHTILFFILSYLLYPWWSSSFEVDILLSEALSSWCLWPWELQIHVYWIVITCSSEQVSSLFSFRRLYRTFPKIQTLIFVFFVFISFWIYSFFFVGTNPTNKTQSKGVPTLSMLNSSRAP